jgi:hypothetical protein
MKGTSFGVAEVDGEGGGNNEPTLLEGVFFGGGCGVGVAIEGLVFGLGAIPLIGGQWDNADGVG